MTDPVRLSVVEEKVTPKLCPTCGQTLAETGSEHATPRDLMGLWNDLASKNLPRVLVMTKQRETHARARLREFGDVQFWEKLIDRINRNPFLRGDSSDWRVTFDWILNPTNLAKIIEGHYDKR